MVLKFFMLAGIFFFFISCAVPERDNPDDSESHNYRCIGFTDGTTRQHYGKSKAQFCDSRDGKKYVYVTIGIQTWMAENWNGNGNGDDKFGFTVLPSGYGLSDGYEFSEGSFYYVGYLSNWWLSDNALYTSYDENYDESNEERWFSNYDDRYDVNYYLLSIRCLKD